MPDKVDIENAVREAAQTLSRGGLVAFPTETVYGLGADASNPEAVKKLFQAKGRPSNHPLIVHVAKLEDAKKWSAEFPETARVLAEMFWPGPLTLILKKARHVPEEVTGGQKTIAIRVPSHPTALALLTEFGGGIAAPSANKFGHLSPTCADDVRAEFGDLDGLLILDGGQCEIGIESTIIDLTGEKPRILRPGMIQSESISVALAQSAQASPMTENSNEDNEDAPRVPGSLPSHYAPNTSLRLVESEEFASVIDELERQGQDTAVLSFKPPPLLQRNWIIAKPFASHYAHTLYRNLRKLDAVGADLIIVEEPPPGPEWEAIKDRLRRAQGKRQGDECDGS